MRSSWLFRKPSWYILQLIARERQKGVCTELALQGSFLWRWEFEYTTDNVIFVFSLSLSRAARYISCYMQNVILWSKFGVVGELSVCELMLIHTYTHSIGEQLKHNGTKLCCFWCYIYETRVFTRACVWWEFDLRSFVRVCVLQRIFILNSLCTFDRKVAFSRIRALGNKKKKNNSEYFWILELKCQRQFFLFLFLVKESTVIDWLGKRFKQNKLTVL